MWKTYHILPYLAFKLTAIFMISRDRYESLWGGNVGNLAVCRCDENGKLCNEPMAFIGILISGPSVRSWCIVVGRNYNTKEKVEAKLKLLKHEVKLRKHSIGFMFACYARGESMFGEKDVESTIFKKLFPEVPLIGSSGDGEIGEGTIGKLTTLSCLVYLFCLCSSFDITG